MNKGAMQCPKCGGRSILLDWGGSESCLNCGKEITPVPSTPFEQASEIVLAEVIAGYRPSPESYKHRCVVCGEPCVPEIIEAYPFGPRKYWPYKIWLAQVKWWRAGCPDKKHTNRKTALPLPGQGHLL